MKPIVVATALWLMVAGAYAAGENLPGVHSTSVAEMLQSKQEAKLREQLAAQGRWDEVRELDQAQARRLEAHKKQSLTKINGKLAVSAPADTPAIDSMGTLCTPLRAAIPMGAKSFAAGSAATDQGTMLVR